MEKINTTILTKEELLSKILEKKQNSYKKILLDKKNKYKSEIIKIKRVVKVVKGGRNFSFSVLVIVGDMKGKIGYALGKANEIPTAARKATRKAEKKMIKVLINNKGSIDFDLKEKHCGLKINLFPAPRGKGIIAGGSVKSVLSLAGYKNIYAKIHGSKNKHNLVNVTFKELKKYTKLNEVFVLRKEN